MNRFEKISQLQKAICAALDPLLDDRPIAIVDFPDIRNCGDSAIWRGEIAYLAQTGREMPRYVSRMKDFSKEKLAASVPDGPILIHGGGNFGDIWAAHQDFREYLLEVFPDRHVIQLPQSIHFGSQARLDEAAHKISRHKQFTLLVRDQESYDLARANFDCEVGLCPDMAFAIGPISRLQSPEFPVLAMLRKDDEAAGISQAGLEHVPVEDWIEEDVRKVRIAKMKGRIGSLLSGRPQQMKFHALDSAATQRLNRGIRQLSRAHAVVTDRLHVHIVSLLMGIPHAVLDNNYGKVRRFIGAFSGGTDLSYLPADMNGALEWASKQADARIAEK